MRDLMMLGALLLFVPLSFANPFNAYLLWGWTAVVSPAFYLYGFMQSVRFNLIFAAIALGMLLVGRKATSKAIRNNSTVLLMTLFLLHTGMCVLFGYPDNPFNEILGVQFFKSILFCLVMTWFVSNRLQMHAVLIMLALGLGFHGVLEGLKVITLGGAHLVIGIPTTMMSDNNHFGVGMVMVIPLLYYLQQHSLNRLAQFGYWAGMLLTVVAVLGTNSRGGMVALAIVGLWFFISSRHKFRALVVVALVSTIVFSVAPASWFERMNSIKDAGEDSSFMGRVAAWKISSAIALENPLTGGGFHSLQVQSVWEKFKYSQGLLGFVTTPNRICGPKPPTAFISKFWATWDFWACCCFWRFWLMFFSCVGKSSWLSKSSATTMPGRWTRRMQFFWRYSPTPSGARRSVWDISNFPTCWPCSWKCCGNR